MYIRNNVAKIIRKVQKQLLEEYNLDISYKIIRRCVALQNKYFDDAYTEGKEISIHWLGNFLVKDKSKRRFCKRNVSKKYLSQRDSKLVVDK